VYSGKSVRVCRDGLGQLTRRQFFYSKSSHLFSINAAIIKRPMREPIKGLAEELIVRRPATTLIIEKVKRV
jgi:hypothetical protein